MSVLTAPPDPALMTAAEFVARYPNHRVELVDGRVKELPVPGLRHGHVCFQAALALGQWAKSGDHGRSMSNDSFVQVRTDPDVVRGPDICYFGYERLPRGPVPEGVAAVAPDLVVKVRSPSDSWTEVFAKVEEYLKADVRTVVVLDPAT